MSSTVSFVATPTDSAAPLGLTVKLNDRVILDTEQLTQSQTVAAEFDDAEDVAHTLTIVLKNKTAAHTKIDEAGEIVGDSMISISDVKLDDLELGHLFFEKAVYQHAFNSDAETQEHAFYGNMGCNGAVEFKFSTPVYIWLLENM
jgi:hypothetical protein